MGEVRNGAEADGTSSSAGRLQAGQRTVPSLSQVQIRAVEASPNDLSYYEARSDATDSSVRIYYEPDLANAAASNAGLLV